MRVIIAIAGGTNMRSDIVTEGACREAALKDERYEFCETTGNLYAEVDDELGDPIIDIPYPFMWVKTDAAAEPSLFGNTVGKMKVAQGHLRGET